jgi:hypothetical protein
MPTLFEEFRMQASQVAQSAGTLLATTWINHAEDRHRLEAGLRDLRRQHGVLESCGPWPCENRYAAEIPGVPADRVAAVWWAKVVSQLSVVLEVASRLADRALTAPPPPGSGETDSSEVVESKIRLWCARSADLEEFDRVCRELTFLEQFIAEKESPRPAEGKSDAPAAPVSEGRAPASQTNPDGGVDKEALALALLFQQPDWSIEQIAARVRVNRKTLYKWKQFRDAAERAGKLKPRGLKARTPRRGYRTSDGGIEAYQDEDE